MSRNAIIDYDANMTVYSTGNDTIYATLGNNDVFVTATPDETVGLSHDLYLGSYGQTLFVNGAGASKVYGGAVGIAMIYDGAGGGTFAGGNNAIIGHGGAALVYGGGNGDTLYAGGAGGAGANVIGAAGGNETLVGASATENNIFHAGNGTDQIVAGSGNDTIVTTYGGSGTITGGAGADLFDMSIGVNHYVVIDFSMAQGDHVVLTGLPPGFSQQIPVSARRFRMDRKR